MHLQARLQQSPLWCGVAGPSARELIAAASRLAPRTRCAAWRTWLNAWPTERRLHASTDSQGTCVFGCRAREHYLRCAILAPALRRALPGECSDEGDADALLRDLRRSPPLAALAAAAFTTLSAQEQPHGG